MIHQLSQLAMLGKPYSVHVNFSAGVVAGIVRIQLQTAKRSLADTPVDFSIEIIGEATHGPVTKRVTPAQAHSSWLAFHSHLLPNGKYTIKWQADQQTGQIKVRIRNTGNVAAQVTQQLQRDEVPLFLTAACDSALYRYDDDTVRPWYDQKNAHELLTKLVEDGQVPAELEVPFRQFVDEGWFEIESHLDSRLIKRLTAAMDHAAASGESGFTAGSSQRLQRMHVKYDSFWDVTTYPKTQQVVDTLMQAPSTVCQVIGFINGTQQAPHQDSIHLSVFPRGYMCGAWLALEDVQADSGELIIYPGSHRWDPVMMCDAGIAKVHGGQWSEFAGTVEAKWRQMAEESGVKPLVYRPKRGSLLIWHERLMHGGSRRLNKSLTRKSCVTHHFAQGGIIYYDSTGLPGKVIERDETKRVLSRKMAKQLLSDFRQRRQ